MKKIASSSPGLKNHRYFYSGADSIFVARHMKKEIANATTREPDDPTEAGVEIERRATKLRKDIMELYEMISRSSGDRVDVGIVDILEPALCSLAKLVIKDCHQKMDEKIYAHQNGYSVCTNQHGPDLQDAEGNFTELKVSRCTGKIKKCNFNWHLPKATSEEERRGKILDSVRAKTKGGGAHLLIKDGKDREIAKFVLSHEFLMEYFSRIKIGRCDNHNMGCNMCLSCTKFHRLEAMQRANDVFVLYGKAAVDWPMVISENTNHKRGKCPVPG